MIEEQRVTTDTLREQNRLLQERVGALETVIEQQRDSSDTFREQNKLLQERVVALESASKEDGDVAIAKRVDDLKKKLDAHGDSVEEIKSSLIVWALKNWTEQRDDFVIFWCVHTAVMNCSWFFIAQYCVEVRLRSLAVRSSHVFCDHSKHESFGFRYKTRENGSPRCMVHVSHVAPNVPFCNVVPLTPNWQPTIWKLRLSRPQTQLDNYKTFSSEQHATQQTYDS